jgi:hypothetical protein
MSRLTQAGRALTKHPDVAGLARAAHVEDGFAACKRAFGNIDGINGAAERIGKRIVMQGIPKRLPNGKVKFTHPTTGDAVVFEPSSELYPDGKFDFWSPSNAHP